MKVQSPCVWHWIFKEQNKKCPDRTEMKWKEIMAISGFVRRIGIERVLTLYSVGEQKGSCDGFHHDRESMKISGVAWADGIARWQRDGNECDELWIDSMDRFGLIWE